MKTNVVYCGDCKDILIEEIPEESIDLIYLDPPFFSGVNYEKIWKNGAEDKAYQEYWKEGINGFIRFMEGRLSLCKLALKSTGSIYLHCDHHANAHLRLLMDRIFGEKKFQREIIWDLGNPSGYKTLTKNWIRGHDTIFFYTKDNTFTFNKEYVKYSKEDLRKYPEKKDRKGLAVTDVWRDIPSIQKWGKEHSDSGGYLTQKPLKLLERIIKASSNENDIILDPMCGGGTTLLKAKELGRKFIGIDVSPIACEKTLTRLGMRQDEMIIIPNCFSHLEKMSPEVFQHWVVRRLGGQPSPTISVDGGIDGYTSFDMIPIQVKKSRDIGSPPIRQFATDIQTKGKKKGIFVALSFNDGAKKIIHELYNKLGVDIELKTAEDIIK